jgi:hypothetical protein
MNGLEISYGPLLNSKILPVTKIINIDGITGVTDNF